MAEPRKKWSELEWRELIDRAQERAIDEPEYAAVLVAAAQVQLLDFYMRNLDWKLDTIMRG